MKEFTEWTIQTIRDDHFLDSWLDERKYDWIPLVSRFITSVLNDTKTVIILSDVHRRWFVDYIQTYINDTNIGRPFLPFYDMRGLYNNFESLKSENGVDLVIDMLDISFPNGYIFWYIGRGQDPISRIAKKQNNSFLWIFDEAKENSFELSSLDEAIDFKILQLYRLLDKTISASLFAEIDVNR
jgi:hypothetical protein